ncbi:hypothetical protein EVAR_26974_1 [Eumeta japonica]|uniref:Uncharacterized protein n=1 Tax=Eumeta variegata TaxID=151549 RepID=A0A4C1VJA6_EUMVA|nr:hypothetical protein EVAR_26974_1 [Eumeta japonica]
MCMTDRAHAYGTLNGVKDPAVVVAGLLHRAAGAGLGMTLWLEPGHLLRRDTDLLVHSFMATICLPSGDRQLTPSPR